MVSRKVYSWPMGRGSATASSNILYGKVAPRASSTAPLSSDLVAAFKKAQKFLKASLEDDYIALAEEDRAGLVADYLFMPPCFQRNYTQELIEQFQTIVKETEVKLTAQPPQPLNSRAEEVAAFALSRVIYDLSPLEDEAVVTDELEELIESGAAYDGAIPELWEIEEWDPQSELAGYGMLEPEDWFSPFEDR